MIELITTLALSAQEPEGCAQWLPDTLNSDFDSCMAGEWGEEESCTSGINFTHKGFTNLNGQSCAIDYLIRDPHTGGFRIGSACEQDDGTQGERQISVLILEDDFLLVDGDISGLAPTLYRCEVPE